MTNSSDDYLSIDTPENVAFGYKVAGIGSRFIAALVDTVIILALQVIVILALLLLARLLLGPNFNFDNPFFAWVLGLLGLVAFLFFWGYYILFEVAWNGQSVGKRWVGLRVIKTDGTPITLTESIVRNLVRLIDFLPAYYGVGVVTMFINAQARRLGDLAAGTLVVYDRETLTLDSLAAKPSAAFIARSDATVVTTLPLERLTDRDIQVAEEFLTRKTELHNSTQLARRILQSLLTKMEISETTLAASLTGFTLPEDILAALVKTYRQRASQPSLPNSPREAANLQPPPPDF